MITSPDRLSTRNPEVATGKSLSALVVEPEEATRRLNEINLRRVPGVSVSTCPDSQTAVALVLQRGKMNMPFDVVLSHNPPQIQTGIAIAQALRAEKDDTPIVILTSDSNTFIRSYSQEVQDKLGIQGVIQKPLLVKQVAELVERFGKNKDQPQDR